MKWLLTVLLLFGASARAYEGKWTPEQVTQLGDAQLKKWGLQLPAKKLWDPKTGKGLLQGAVWIDGCSAAFVSPDGLLVTNHHCLFSILQEHSTKEKNLIKEGYLAKSRAEELTGKTERVRVPRKFTDVTKEMLAAVPSGADDLARFRALEKKGKELVAECEKRPATRCQIASFDGGLWYTLVDTLELADVRLVYAPPLSVGEYGGEIDNWMWPRHTGDFAIGRVYLGADGTGKTYAPDNVPYKPEFFFPLSKKGVTEDDFVMVLGYPGRTYRALIAEEVAERRDNFFPARRDLYAEWISAIDRSTEKDEGAAILMADDLKSLHNRKKNAEGQLAGFARGKLLEKRQANEERVIAWAKTVKVQDEALKARDELEALAKKERSGFLRDFLVDHLHPFGGVTISKSLFLPTTLVRAARERKKADLDRDPSYMDRNRDRLRDALEREQKRLDVKTDKLLTLSFIRHALKLPKDARISGIDKAFAGVADTELPKKLDELYAKSKVLDAAERGKMFGESEEQLRARKDPLLELGFGLADDVAARVDRRDTYEGAVSRLRPSWRRAVIAEAGKPVDPDANSTLRVTFARVKGYSPQDAVWMKPQTTLSGMLAKDRNAPPFDPPARIEAAAAAGKLGPWKDNKLRDVPVAFLADADTTGGNSGSPTVNAKGELVGVNFDRVWENVANDFGYNPDIARNVSADVRYLLWILDQVEDAGPLLKELGVR